MHINKWDDAVLDQVMAIRGLTQVEVKDIRVEEIRPSVNLKKVATVVGHHGYEGRKLRMPSAQRGARRRWN